MLEVEEPASAQPAAVAAAQVGETQQQPQVIQVAQDTAIVDKQRDDVVMATQDDVTRDVISGDGGGSDTDDAPEVITDSLSSRDHRDATNQHHDHQHPAVSHHFSLVY